MLLDARRPLAADDALVHRMIGVAVDIGDRAVFQIHLDAATAGAHVASRGLDLVPGLGRSVDGGFGHVLPV